MSERRADEIVAEWQDAANAQDAERTIALSTEDVELGGPRGSGRGHSLLRDWLARARLTVEARRVFVREDRVVVDQHAVWHGEDGRITGVQDLAAAFVVREGRVARCIRFSKLEDALEAADLSEKDEASPYATGR